MRVQSFLTRTDRARRAERRTWALTVAASAALHALLLALVLAIGPPAPRTGAPGWVFAPLTDEGGGGGGQPTLVALSLGSLGPESIDPLSATLPPLPPPPEVEEVPLPEIALTLEIPVPEPPVAPPPLAPDPRRGIAQAPAGGGTPGTGSGAGGGAGPGSGPGAGPGSGPGSGAEAGDGVRPPAPLTILMPPTVTDAVRGGGAKVLLQVDSAGRVSTADVVVSSGDRRYDEALRRVALGWRFRPARDAANRPVPYPFEVSVTF